MTPEVSRESQVQVLSLGEKREGCWQVGAQKKQWVGHGWPGCSLSDSYTLFYPLSSVCKVII